MIIEIDQFEYKRNYYDLNVDCTIDHWYKNTGSVDYDIPDGQELIISNVSVSSYEAYIDDEFVRVKIPHEKIEDYIKHNHESLNIEL